MEHHERHGPGLKRIGLGGILLVAALGGVALGLVIADRRPPARGALMAGRPPATNGSGAVAAATTVAPVTKASLEAEVRRQLEAARPELVAGCWQTTARPDRPLALTFSFNLSFSPEGRLLGIGISEPRQPGAGEVGSCLRARPLDLVVTPPGRAAVVDVDLALPG